MKINSNFLLLTALAASSCAVSQPAVAPTPVVATAAALLRPIGPADSRGVTPVQVAVSDAALSDLRDRIGRTRWPQTVTDAGWDYGADLAFMRRLADTWQNRFDWRKEERRINKAKHYRVAIDGMNVHFIHAESSAPDAVPLLLLHGWPSSFVQMLELIPRLTEAGEGASFHVVAASLPGYGLSDAASTRGMSVSKIAAVMTELMTEKLGYPRFAGRASDLGAGVLQQIALRSPKRVIGLHLSGTNPYVYQVPNDLSDEEKVFVERAQQWMQQEMAYAMMHSTKPQTVGFALSDSPIGMAAWIMEKFWRWSDPGSDLSKRYGDSALLANLTLYWVTGSIAPSMRLYYETVRDPGAYGRVEVPTAMLMTSKDMFPTPRAWAARSYNVVRWTELSGGGHFLEWDETLAVARDLRATFAHTGVGK